MLLNRIPYPLNDGGAIGSYHFVKGYVNADCEVRCLAMNTTKHFTDLKNTGDAFDQMLDIWIEPNGTWSWKDWDELVEAERVGLFTGAKAEAIRAEGRRAIDSLGTVLPTGWEDWQPDPAWALPTLPEGWDQL